MAEWFKAAVLKIAKGSYVFLMGINNHELFRLPRVIQNNIHRDFWVTHYPSSLCNESGNIKNTFINAENSIKDL